MIARRLDVVVIYDNTFKEEFGGNATSKVDGIMSNVNEMFSETSFKSIIELNILAIHHADTKLTVPHGDEDTGSGRYYGCIFESISS